MREKGLLRRMVRGTTLATDDLVYPVFAVHVATTLARAELARPSVTHLSRQGDLHQKGRKGPHQRLLTCVARPLPIVIDSTRRK
jgi:delta-aminolevulinic acid dehydratase/porphobilinogen synthase